MRMKLSVLALAASGLFAAMQPMVEAAKASNQAALRALILKKADVTVENNTFRDITRILRELGA